MKKIEIEIPIFRAKKIEGGDYVIGHLFWGNFILLDIEEDLSLEICGKYYDRRFDFGSGDISGAYYQIDLSTLAIHLPDMVDSQSNKIFASLNESGKGGDILEWTIFPDDMPKLRINGVPYYYRGGTFKVTGRIEMMWHLLAPHRECKIIGIQE